MRTKEEVNEKLQDLVALVAELPCEPDERHEEAKIRIEELRWVLGLGPTFVVVP